MTRARVVLGAAGLAVASALGLRPLALVAQPVRQDTEAEIKAAYLLRFVGFVEWPEGAFAGPEEPLRLGVLDADRVAAALSTLSRGRLKERRPIVTKRLRADEGVADLHALFVGHDSTPRLPALIAAAAGHPLLTVSENGEKLVPGSAINFVLVDGKVRFDVALPVAEALRVKISARLLTVARRVLQSS